MKHKLTIPIIVAAILLVGVLAYFFFFARSTPQSIDLNEEVGYLPAFVPPSLEEAPYYNLALSTVDWFEPFRVPDTDNLLPVSIRCGPNLDECEPEGIVAHRNIIPRLWAMSLLVGKTHDVGQLSLLLVTSNALYKYMQPQPDGTQYIWQTEYYHCFLIDQILSTTPWLKDTAREQLASFCAEASGEVTVGSDASQIATKVQYLSSDDPTSAETYIYWAHNQSTYEIVNNDYTAAEEGYPFAVSQVNRALKGMLEQNIIYLSDRVIKEGYQAQTQFGETTPLDNILDGALSSCYLTLQIPDLTPEEKYVADQELLLGLQTYIDHFPQQADEYGLPDLESRLLSQLVPPDVVDGPLVDRLYIIIRAENRP